MSKGNRWLLNLIPGVGPIAYGTAILNDLNKKKKCTNNCKARYTADNPRRQICIDDCKSFKPPRVEPNSPAYYDAIIDRNNQELEADAIYNESQGFSADGAEGATQTASSGATSAPPTYLIVLASVLSTAIFTSLMYLAFRPKATT
jgi:hypothetical protein